MAATVQIAPSSAQPAAPSTGIALWTPDGVNAEFVDQTGANHIVGTGNVSTSGSVAAGEVAVFTDATGKTIAGVVALPNSSLAGPINGTIDVTKYGVSPSNTAAANTTALNTLLAGSGAGAAPAGSIIYFPGGTYQFSGLITVGASFIFQGQGTNYTGGFTILQQTANVGGLFTITAGKWYSQFRDITFSCALAQTSGAAVNVGNNVGINFFRCQFQATSATTTWYDCIDYIGANSANSSIVETCQLSGFTNYGIFINSLGASLVVVNSIIQGIYGTSTQVAAAGIATTSCGALQIDNCDILGATNNVLSNPGSGGVVSSIFVSNTYFDNASGSNIKITGAGATVRTRFVQCGITLAATASGFAAVEVSTTYASGAPGLDFLGCNVLNTFGTTGTSYGFNFISGAADVALINCRVAGWTTGIAVTPLSGVTALQIESSTIGTSGGYAGNATGISLAAGSYASILISGNNVAGNTGAAIVDNSTATTNQKVIKDNVGAIVAGGLASIAAAVVGTASELQVVGATLPAYAAQPGTTLRMRLFGQATVTAAGTITFRVRIGPTSLSGAIAASIANTTVSGAAIDFDLEVYIVFRTIGTSGTAIATIKQFNNAVTGLTATATVMSPVNGTAIAAATVNTTVANVVEFTTLSAAATSTPTFNIATIEALR